MQGVKLTFENWQPVGPVGFNFYWPELTFTGTHKKRCTMNNNTIA
jgi:hypothetical protein